MRIYKFTFMHTGSVLFLFCVLCLQGNAYAKADSLRFQPGTLVPEDSLEAAADTGMEAPLEQRVTQLEHTTTRTRMPSDELFKKYTGDHSGESLEQKLGLMRTQAAKQKKTQAFKENATNSRWDFHQKKIRQQRQKRARKYRRNAFWKFLGNLLDLDWITVGIAVFLPALLVALLYFLLGGTALTFIQMFLFALGFGFAVFSYIFLLTEYTAAQGNYEFFVRYGLFSWPGILAIIAGFVGLFGGTSGSFFTYLLVGLGLGLFTFLLSILFKKSILNKT